jgi:UbiD family decarboxylase
MDNVFYVLTTHGTDIYDNYRDFYLTQDDIGDAYFAPCFNENVIRFEEDTLHEILAKPYSDEKYLYYHLLSDLKHEAEEYKKKTGKSYWVTYDHIYLKKVVILNDPIDSFHFENKTVVYDDAYLDEVENNE